MVCNAWHSAIQNNGTVKVCYDRLCDDCVPMEWKIQSHEKPYCAPAEISLVPKLRQSLLSLQ